jgi:2-polyprenyl-6-methoxyphenol hydroxylase-like FAD-dependent oxidoreductase
MSLSGSRVGVVGGSIAGCAAAIALARAGCEVEVFERSTGELRDRGSGIALPHRFLDELVARGFLAGDYVACVAARRWWVIADGSTSGRLLWDQPVESAMNNWGVLWRSLRAQVPDSSFRNGCEVRDMELSKDGVSLRLSDGGTPSFDAVVGADGYRSLVRQRLHSDSLPVLADYVLWRGNYEESRIAARDLIERADKAQAWLKVVFSGGNGVIFLIPGFDGRAGPGWRRVNWAIYTGRPPGVDPADLRTIPPGAVGERVYAHLAGLLRDAFPPEVADLVRLSAPDEVALQPVYDKIIDCYGRGRILVMGDAGTIARPHTASGAAKALQDALALEQLAVSHDNWGSAIAAYDAERTKVSRSLAEIGRRIGSAQVASTPDWQALTPADLEAWTKATLAGERLYLYEAPQGERLSP